MTTLPTTLRNPHQFSVQPVTMPIQRRSDWWQLEKMISIYNFLLTVKVVTLIFISGCGSAISSTQQGKSGSIYNLVKNESLVWAVQGCVHFMKS